MKTLDGGTLGPGSDAEVSFNKAEGFPEQSACSHLIVKYSMPVKNTSGGSLTLSNANALAIMQHAAGNWTMKFGKVAEELVDDGRSFDEMRIFLRDLTGGDHLFNKKELRNYQSSDSDAVVIGAGATVNVHMAFIRPFVYERMGKQLTRWCPGTSQVRQLAFTMRKGATAMPTNFTQDGNATLTYLVDVVPCPYDKWAAVARFAKTNDSSLTLAGPAGTLLAVHEANATGPATAVGRFSIKRESDTPVHDTVLASDVVNDRHIYLPEGEADPNDIYATLYAPLEQVTEEELYTSDRFRFEAQAQDYSPFKLIWVFLPRVTEKYADVYAGDNTATSEAGTNVQLVNEPALRGHGLPPHATASAPIAILRPGHPRYGTMPGLRKSKDQPAQQFVPTEIAETTAKAVESVGADSKMGEAIAIERTLSLAKLVPGAVSATRGKATAEEASLAKLVAPAFVERRGALIFDRIGRVA